MVKDDVTAVNKILEKNMYLNIATVGKDGLPWQSTVFFAYEITDKLTFYWYSAKDSRHTRNIIENSNIAGNIYNSTDTGSDIQAVYVEGMAVELGIQTILPAIKAYAQRLFSLSFFDSPSEVARYARKSFDFLGGSQMRFYKMKVLRTWLLNPPKDYKGHTLDTRSEIIY